MVAASGVVFREPCLPSAPRQAQPSSLQGRTPLNLAPCQTTPETFGFSSENGRKDFLRFRPSARLAWPPNWPPKSSLFQFRALFWNKDFLILTPWNWPPDWPGALLGSLASPGGRDRLRKPAQSRIFPLTSMPIQHHWANFNNRRMAKASVQPMVGSLRSEANDLFHAQLKGNARAAVFASERTVLAATSPTKAQAFARKVESWIRFRFVFMLHKMGPPPAPKSALPNPAGSPVARWGSAACCYWGMPPKKRPVWLPSEARRQFQIAKAMLKSLVDEPDPPWVSPEELERLFRRPRNVASSRSDRRHN